MIDPFLIKLILSFIVGGLWIMGVSVLIEKLGTKIGGIIGGLPSIALVSFFFIGLVQGPIAASEATISLLFMTGVTSIFLLILMRFIEKGYIVALLISLFVWFLAGGLIASLKLNNFNLSIGVWITLIAFCYYLVRYKFDIKSQGKVAIKYSPQQIVGRALFAGSVVAFAVLMSRIGGPLFGGIFAAFPATYLSAFTIAYHKHGVRFSRALAQPLLIGGMTTTPIYAIAVHYFYPPFGIILGTIFSYAISIASAFLVYLFIKTRLK